jgi:hypothetical protein
MCVGGNSRSDAIRVKGMIACNYRRMPIRALSEIDAASMARLALLCPWLHYKCATNIKFSVICPR